jgi:hypothetical protein
MDINQQNDFLTGKMIYPATSFPNLIKSVDTLLGFIAVVKNPTVVMHSGQVFSFYDKNLEIVPSISGHIRKGIVTKVIPYNAKLKSVAIKGNVSLIVMMDHYWHMLYETVLQIVLIQRFLKDKDKSVATWLASSPINTKKLSQMMHFCHIVPSSVKPMEPNVNYVIKGRVYYLKPPPEFPHMWLLDYYTHHISKPLIIPKLFVYVPRGGAKNRLFLNEGELIDMLVKKFNFTIFTVEQLDLYQQIDMARNAKVFMSCNGTGFSANLAFTNHKEVIAIELIGQKAHTRTGFCMAKYLNLRHYLIQAVKSAHENENVVLDLTSIETALNKIFVIEKLR